MQIQKIVVTGGPRGGKDGIIPYVRKRLRDEWGILALGVPEVATEFYASGAEMGDGGATPFDFQKHVLPAQMEHEHRFEGLLFDIMRNLQKQFGVLLCNRGLKDNEPYIKFSDFIRLKEHLGMSDLMLRDAPYEGIVFCESSAVHFPRTYMQEDNLARQERTAAEAAALDFKTRNAWVGHPHLWIVPGMKDFEKKEKAYRVVCHILGLPKPYEIERKFLVREPDWREFEKRNIRVVPVPLERVYLKSSKTITWRIRKRGESHPFLYYETKKEKVSAGVRIDPEARIEAVRYQKLFYEYKDVSCDIVKKVRHCFLYDDQYNELNKILSPRRHEGLFILEKEIFAKDDPVILPPYGSGNK